VTAMEVAAALGVDPVTAAKRIVGCDSVIETDRIVAMREGRTCHVAVRCRGLGGRAVLRECRETLQAWLNVEPVLVAPVRHENVRALRLVEALGFRRYSETPQHIWLAIERRFLK